MLILVLAISGSLLAVCAVFWAVYALIPTLWLKYKAQHGARSGGDHVRTRGGIQEQRQGVTSAREKSLLLTFDDGPHPYYTGRLLDLLAALDVRACFFLLAENAAEQPALVRRMTEEGHQVALHGMRHENLWTMGPGQSHRHIEGGLACLKKQGQEPRYYRPPYGNINLCALYKLRRLGLRLLLWDVMVGDWRRESTAAGLAARLSVSVRAQSVICLHDGSAGSGAPGAPERMIEALSLFIPAMRERGYRFALPERY